MAWVASSFLLKVTKAYLEKMTEVRNGKYYVVQDLWKCQDRHVDVDSEGAVVQLPGEQFSSVILIQSQDLTVLKFKHQNLLLFRHQKFTFSSDSSLQSTARLHLWLILTQLPSSHVNLSGKHVVRVRDLFAPVNILYILHVSNLSKNISELRIDCLSCIFVTKSPTLLVDW